MEVLKEEKAQGATEYLLMLAAVLVIVIVMIWYVMKFGGEARTAPENQDNQVFDNP